MTRKLSDIRIQRLSRLSTPEAAPQDSEPGKTLRHTTRKPMWLVL